jgi:hypothetical protein
MPYGTLNPAPGFAYGKPQNPTKVFTFVAITAPHQANYATISNYLAMELRYMEAGEERLTSASAEPVGIPGYQ